VLERIDDILGKMDVQRAEIDSAIQAAKQAVEGVRKAKIKAEVKRDQINDKARLWEERIAQCDQTLAKLRDLLKADMPAQIAGKTYSVAELKEMANKVIQARKDAENQLNGFKTARESLQKVLADLTKQQQAMETRIASLESQIGRLDAEMAAAKAMKDASAAMGDQDVTLAANLDRLEKKVVDLIADVRAELRSESERWSAAHADKAMSEVDAFIENTQTSYDILAEIDRILGSAKN
jgi:phage shock protein A